MYSSRSSAFPESSHTVQVQSREPLTTMEPSAVAATHVTISRCPCVIAAPASMRSIKIGCV
jgi:hypothetical protein